MKPHLEEPLSFTQYIGIGGIVIGSILSVIGSLLLIVEPGYNNLYAAFGGVFLLLGSMMASCMYITQFGPVANNPIIFNNINSEGLRKE